MPFVTLGPSSHDSLSDVSVDDHHTQAHNLDTHATRVHANLSDAPADAHHAQAHITTHEIGGNDSMATAKGYALMRLFSH